MEPVSPGALLLFELRGENPGSSRGLAEGVFRIGSDRENDLILKDASLSLYQAEIRVAGNECEIRNLAPQGRVFLNGDPFEDAVLKPGDILTLGKAMFRVVFPGEIFTQKELWLPVGSRQPELPPATMPLRWVSLLLLTLFALVVFLVVLNQRKGGKVTLPGPERLAKFQKEIDIDERRRLYDYGVDLFSARRWDGAVLIFETIRQSAPNYKDTERLYRLALEESDSLDALTQAKGLFLEGGLLAARLSLEKVPETSVYKNEAKRILREVDGRLAEGPLGEAEKRLAEGNWDQARGLAREALRINPQDGKARKILHHADLQPGSEPVGRVISRLGSSHPEVAAPAGYVRPPPPRRRAALRVRASPGASEWYLEQAAARYQRGDLEGSLQRLDPVLRGGSIHAEGARGRAREMAEDLRQARVHFDKAREVQGTGRLAESLEHWGRFLERDQRLMGGFSSTKFEQASGLLGKIYYGRGREEFDRGNLPGAYRFWSMAEQVNAQDQEVGKGMEQLSASAREIYREGYVLQELNPGLAMEKWRVVTEIVRPSNPYHEKARAGLDWWWNHVGQSGEWSMDRDREIAVRSAQGLYREGYILGEVNPELAVRKWKKVLRIAKRQDLYHQMAIKKILFHEEAY